MSAVERCPESQDGDGQCVLDADHKGHHAWEKVSGPPGPPQRWDALVEIPDTSTKVQLPAEPCVVLWDGEACLVANLRTTYPVQNWARQVGPIVRTVTAAHLRALADLIDGAFDIEDGAR